MNKPENNVISSVRRFIRDHKPLLIWGALYIVAVVVGFFFSPWESRMVEDLVTSATGLMSMEVNFIETFFPGPYDILSFFFHFTVESGKPNVFIMISGLLVLTAEMILEKVLTKKFTSDVRLIEKFFISFFSSNVIFSATAYLFVLICPLLEAVPDVFSDSIIFKIIAIAALVLFIPVILNILLFLCSFALYVFVAALLSVNHFPVFIIWIVVLVLAFATDWLSTKISGFFGRVIWSIIPFLRPLADLLRDD